MTNFTEKFASKKASTGFISKIIREKSIIYHYETTLVNGQKYFFILDIDKSKHKKFQEDISIPQEIDLNNYGKILHKGYGQPSKELKAELKQKYGLYEDESNI